MLRLQIDEPPRPATASSTFQHRVGADALLHQTLRRRNRDEQLSATDYLRERRAKERAKEREFEHQLRDEGRARDNRNVACVGEANRWAAELDDPRQFRVHRDAPGAELKVAVVERRERPAGLEDLITARNVMSMRLFMREHRKLAQQIAAMEDANPDTADADGAPGGAPGAQSGAKPADALHQQRLLSRRETQAELRSLLSETEALTQTLEGQLDMIRSRGWNLPFDE